MAPIISSSSGSSSSSSSSSAVVLSSAVAIVLSSVSGDDEGRGRRGRPPPRRWAVDDEIKIVDTIASLRTENMGHPPAAAVLLRALQAARPPLLRRGLDASALSQKVYNLKKKFIAAAATNGRKRLRNKRNKVLYKHGKKAWPEELRRAKATAAAKTRRTSCGGRRVGF
uniref:Uncharacterized protein n=1 Tax=Oryza brachyantha TaxID=4533 RepID=J3MVH5_ORYBR